MRRWTSSKLMISIMLAVLGLIAPTPFASAQDCAQLTAVSAKKLEKYLEKKLTFELSKKGNELISDWREFYENDDLLEDSWTATTTISQGEIAAEQAEIEYRAAFENSKTACNGG